MASHLMKFVFLLAIICSLLVPSQSRIVKLRTAKSTRTSIKSLRVSGQAVHTRSSHRDSEEEEEKLILNLFHKFDKDGSGAISGLELKKAFDSIGMKISPEEADEYINKYDQNDSNSIDFDEFDELYHDLLDDK